MKKIIITLLSVLLTLSFYSCKKKDNGNNNPSKQNDPTIETSFVSELEKKVETGVISKDTYINTTLLGVFDSKYIPEEYKKEDITITDVRPYLEEAEMYWDELSDETKTAIADMLTLSFIQFDDEGAQTGIVDWLIDGMFEDVNALSKNVLIKDVLQSNSGRFNIWFSDGDPNSATKAQAQMVADTLDEATELYDSYFNTEFRYYQEALYGGITTNKQQYLLKKNGYEASSLFSCLNVYLCDYTDSDAMAVCCSGIRGFMEQLIIPFIPDSMMDNHGIAIFPYIIIDSDVPFDGLMKEVVYHELFHYYQNDVLKDDIAQCDLLGIEATANWAAAMNVTIDDGTIDFSKWSSNWQKDGDNWFNMKSKNVWGYGLYKAVYHYQENVDDGLNKIVNALYEPDFLTYLEDNATLEERKAMMQDLAYRGFENDYEYPALIAKTPHDNITDLKENSKFNNVVAPKLSVKYYKIDAGKTKNPAIHFTASRSEISGTLFVRYKDGTYSLISSTLSMDDTLQLPQDDSIAETFIAISNASFSQAGTYALAIVEGQAVSEAFVIEKTVLMDDENLKIVAESAYKKKNVIYVTCSYENKTANKFALNIGHSVINGYVFGSYIKDYYLKYMPIEPNGKGTFDFNLYTNMSGHTYDLLSVLNCNAIGEVGVSLLVGHFKDNGKGETDYKVGPCYFKTANYGKENMTTSVLQSYGKSNSKLGLSKLLTYQSINRDVGDIIILGAAVYQIEDGSHIVIVEAENTGNNAKSTAFNITKVNGYEFDMYNSIKTEAGCKTIDNISTFEISASERMKLYGFSSIGSYTIKFGSNINSEFEVTLNFGNESTITTKQKLIEDKKFTFSYVGSGMKMIEYIEYEEDMEVVFAIDVTDERFNHPHFEDSVILDGKEIDCNWYNAYANNGFIILSLRDVDPTKSHSLTFNVSYYDDNYQIINKTIHIQI